TQFQILVHAQTLDDCWTWDGLVGSGSICRLDTPTPVPTGPPPPSPTPCAISFSDVHPTDYFYTPVLYLACHGVISGYADGTFRPYNLTTRGQLAKIVVLAEAWPFYTPPTPTFQDVPPPNLFHPFRD